ncbi:uncharacterized protein LOC134225197 isoform X2 [Armigeres subalbatus]
MRFAAKPFNASDNACKVIRFLTPNLYELREIARHFGYKEPIANTLVENFSHLDELLGEVRKLGTFVGAHIDNVIVTLGYYGVVIVRRACEHTPFFDSRGAYQRQPGDELQVRFYPGRKLDFIVNVSGAGDSFSSGFISAMLEGRMEPVCVEVGFEAACCALGSKGAVADLYFDRSHACWDKEAGARFIAVE